MARQVVEREKVEAGRARPKRIPRQALAGVRIADFCWYYAGPMVGGYFARHGAEVIRMESSIYIDGHRMHPPYKDNIPGVNRGTGYNRFNINKWAVTLNLRHPKGVEIAKRVVAWAGIATNNFRPGALENLGLGYEELKKVRPDLIMLCSTNQGSAGPHRMLTGFGSHLVSQTGFSYLTGWPDGSPVPASGPITDPMSYRLGTVALLAAIDYRRRTGKGQFIDLSQYELSLHFQSPLLLDYNVNRRVPIRNGNRCSVGWAAAPHGVFPCLGEDRWCAIAVFSDEEWRSLCKVMGAPSLADDPRFSTALRRKQNEDELERVVAGWTSNLTAEEVTERLQAAGVAAGVVKDGRDMFQDPQLKERGYYQELEHPEIGRNAWDRAPFKLSKTPTHLRRAAPCLGQDNEYVYTQILGIPDEEFVELLQEGVFN